LRLDIWLKRVCLVKSRSLAKRGCQSGDILLAGQSVKESHSLRVDEILSLTFPARRLEIRVADIPEGNVSKKSAPDFYEVLKEERLEKEDPRDGI
jgi:ribosomal 50S subunit-recycling heat shock protein